MAERMLKRLGYDVETRSNGFDALKRFKSEPDHFDLVITDLSMPQMTGEKLAVEIIKIRSDIPVIICTEYSGSLSEDKVKEIGIKAFVMKPIVMKDMAKTVRKVLD